VNPFSSAAELAGAIRAHRMSASEVLDTFLARIAKHNPALNAICTLDEAGARERARQADQALARGEVWGPLHGVPMTIKDALETAGMRTTGGHPPLSDHIPTRDATAVARLRQAGAVLMGKTNVPPLSADYRADNPIFGRTNNPWGLDRTPGGSTGGGAAAVAAGLSAFDVGSDLAGSVRTPGHYCGLFALKPTERRVPNTGHIPEPPGLPRAVRHMNCLGPLARSIEDLELILRVISGSDDAEWDVPPVVWADAQDRPLKSVRVAWSTNFGGIPVTEDTKRAIAKLANELQGIGCRVEERNPDGFDFELAWETWGALAIAERAATAPERVIERVDALRATLGDVAVARGSAMGARATVADYMLILNRRDTLIAALEKFLQSWDIFLCPVSVGPAVPHVPFGTPIQVDNGTVPYFLAGTSYSCPFNLTGNPAVVLPLARSTKERLPIGVQVVGRRWREPELLTIASKLAHMTGPFEPPPLFDA
jgi:amidase